MFCAFFADSALVFNIWLSTKEAPPQFCLKSYFETAPSFSCKKYRKVDKSTSIENGGI
jgi:hypothetical protein